MAKDYKVGERYYLPVTVRDGIGTSYNYPIVLEFVDCEGRDTTDTICIADEPDLLLTAEDIAAVINTERDDALAELKSRNAELEALLKEVMATRDEAIRQNDELIAENSKLKADRNNWHEAAQRYHDNAKVADAAADNLRKENGELKAKVTELSVENDKLKSDCNDWKDTADDRIIDVQTLAAERDNLKADLTTQKEVNEELKAWYEEANKTASEAAEANDELKAKIADLRNRVGEQLAQIQDLNAEVHFLKEERDLKAKLAQEWHDNAHSTAKGLDELKGRCDELDSVNKEQAEKIRRQDKALADLKKRNDDLQAENTNLTFLLEDAPEKGAARKVHVITNDGKEYMFRKCTKASFDNYNDFTVLKIYEGDTYVAGFLRGDSPANFAAWWTE